MRRGGAYPPEHFLFSSALGLKLTANRRAILSRNFEAKITRPIRALIELIFALKRRKNEKTLENHRRASTMIKNLSVIPLFLYTFAYSLPHCDGNCTKMQH